MLNFKVDEKLCVKCGLCVEDCPMKIIDMPEGSCPSVSTAKELSCLACQHCLAICPTGALSIMNRDPKDSIVLTKASLPSPEQMATLIKGRRSVRKFKQENVSRELIDEMLAVVANCPTGINRQDLVFTVVDCKEYMDEFRAKIMDDLVQAAQLGAIPERYDYLKKMIFYWKKSGVDVIFRSAPHFLVVSASSYAACPEEDVNLALAYFELLAASNGLGTTWCGNLKMALEVLPKYKKRLNLSSTTYYYPMIFGIPAVKYRRTVQRDDAAVVNKICRK
ncbi:MAG: nitroreductase family protein [Sedimentisphaerales bacterium]|nr:nitroreductase family protein [Sedimentisphaerales bacterium]